MTELVARPGRSPHAPDARPGEGGRRGLSTAADPCRAVAARRRAPRPCLAAGRGPADCEDIVQETLLAIHLKRDTRDETQPIEPWLRAIAHYKLVDHLRRRGFTDHLDIDDYAEDRRCRRYRCRRRWHPNVQCWPDCRSASAASSKRFPWKGTAPPKSRCSWGMSEGAVRVTLHRAH